MKYIPGQWIGIALPGAAVLFEPGASAEDLDALREQLSERGVEGFVDSLVLIGATSGRPVAGFAAVTWRDGVTRVAARGEGVVKELGVTEPRALDGNAPSLQLEQTWEGAHTVRLAAPGADIDASGVLWLESGVVFAASIDVDVRMAEVGPATVQPAAPEPVVVATPIPAADPEPIEQAVAAPMETMIPDFTQDVSATSAREPELVPAPSAIEAPEGPEAQTTADAEDDLALDLTFGDIWGATLSIDDLGKVAPSQLPTPGAPKPEATTPEASTPPAAYSSPPAAHVPAPTTAPAPPTPRPERHGLIDGIPDVVRGPASTNPGAAVPSSAPLPAPASAPTSQPRLGDHDGSTVSVADMMAMQSGPPSTPIHTGTGSFSQRRRGRALVSTGQVFDVDRTIIIGRLPRASRITGQPPHLVAVPSPQQDISRNHVEIRLEGSAVVVVDLNTTNGTVLQRVGADAERLHPGEPTVVRNGDVIDLGDNVTVTFEGIA